MSTEKMREEFLTWWWHDDQQEMRMSCAQGWALHIWLSSRAAIEVELPREDRSIIGECKRKAGVRTWLERLPRRAETPQHHSPSTRQPTAWQRSMRHAPRQRWA